MIFIWNYFLKPFFHFGRVGPHLPWRRSWGQCEVGSGPHSDGTGQPASTQQRKPTTPLVCLYIVAHCSILHPHWSILFQGSAFFFNNGVGVGEGGGGGGKQRKGFTFTQLRLEFSMAMIVITKHSRAISTD